MSYYNGTVANLSGLLTALTTACVTDGWTYAGGELVKHGCYFPISVDAYSGAYQRLRMQIKDPSDSAVSLVSGIKEQSDIVISYPAEYHIFTFDKEVYTVLNISPGTYAWISFGASSISVPGTGAFLSASGSDNVQADREYNRPGFFFSNPTNSYRIHQASSMDTGFSFCYPFRTDDTGVNLGIPASTWYYWAYGIGTTQPNNFSGESILTPMQIWSEYSSSKYCLTFVSEHARYVRIDNYEDEQIITYGADKWMIFPWMKRNAATRTKFDDYSTANTGTFGWAIRYEGP